MRLFLIFAILLVQQPAAAVSRAKPVELLCQGEKNPLAVDSATPEFSWRIRSVDPAMRGVRQSAYRILAATTPDRCRPGAADLWDSGRVKSSETLQILYAGRPLRSRQRVWWSVTIWDERGQASSPANPGNFEMGLLSAEDWKAAWITADLPPPSGEAELYAGRPLPLFRKQFNLPAVPRTARCYVTGLGYAMLWINGRRIGENELDPAWTNYRRRVFYSAYDVTPYLRAGANCIGIEAGSGWWDPLPLRLFGRFNLREHLPVGPPQVLAQLECRDAAGTLTQVATGSDWLWAPGPIQRSNLYLGEIYDARKELQGWNRPGEVRGGWRPVQKARPLGGLLQVQPLPPIRVRRTLPARRLPVRPDGALLWDTGQNLAGRVKIRVRGARGSRVVLRYGELLLADGGLNVMTSVAGQIKRARPEFPHQPPIAWQSDTYVLSGRGEEVWAPRFTFHGFRYIETRVEGSAEILSIDAELMSSNLRNAGDFICSSDLFNRIQKMARWTFLSNVFSVQSDCPHREKFGYGGDIVAAGEAYLLNFDMERFYRKTVLDFADAQRPNGGFTETAPFVGIADEGLGDGSGPVGWGTAHPMLLEQLYRYYGDRATARQQWPRARRWMDLLEASARDGLLDNGISDHEALTPKPRELTGTAFYFWNSRILSRLADVLGFASVREKYEAKAAAIRARFNSRFLDRRSGKYGGGTQTEQAFPLALDMAPAAEAASVQQQLIQSLLHDPGHLTTGIFGTRFMFQALTEGGRADVASRVVNRDRFPGWGHMLDRGATTLWEHWEYSDNTYSHNHPMFGSVSEWFFKALGGLNADGRAPGWREFQIRPQIVDEVDWVRCSYRSARGLIRCNWRRNGAGLRVDLEAPANTNCTFYMPAAPGAAVTEGGRAAERQPGVRRLFVTPDAVAYRLEPGRYSFSVSRFAAPVRPAPASPPPLNLPR